MKKLGIGKALLVVFASAMIFAACSNSLDDPKDHAIISAKTVECGSLTVTTGAERAVFSSEIKTAIVTVSGFDSNGAKFTKTSGVVPVSEGKGNGIKINSVPVSKNCSVMVQAFGDSAASKKIEGLAVYARTDILAGNNSVAVNQASSNEGLVYTALINAGVNTNTLSSSQTSAIKNATPTSADVNYSLVNAVSIASDYKAGIANLKNKTAYITEPVSVSVIPSNVSGYTVQISDQVSEVKTMGSAEVSYMVAPGKWTVYVMDDAGKIKASKAVTVSSDSSAPKISVSRTLPVDTNGKIVVHVPVSTGYENCYAWSDSKENYLGTWPGKTMTKNDGLNCYDITVPAASAHIIFNKGDTKTKDLFLTEGEWNYIGKDGGVTDDDGSNISSNFSKVSADGQVSISIDYGTNPPASDGITVHAKYSNCYAWVESSPKVEPFGAWPGATMNSEGETGWKWIYIPVSSVKLIFNNSGSGQTENEKISEPGEYWYFNGVWYNENPEDGIAPELVSFTSSKTGKVSGDVVLTVNATDDRNLGSAVISCDGKELARISMNGTEATGTYTWETAKLKNGSHTLVCSVKDAAGNSSRTKSITLTTENENLPPVAVISGARKPSEGVSVTYKASGSYDQNGGTIKSYKWTVTGSGATVTSGLTGSELKLTTKSAGQSYVVSLVVTDDEGAASVAASLECEVSAVDADWDFRDETIYFVMTTRFYDGDSSNNRYCWGDEVNLKSKTNNDPGWRGDFKGLIEKLDYIKALGFTSIWITPVVENASDLDYHGYHAYDFSKVDPRYESAGATYQDLIDACHAKGIKVIQDIVLNHCSNNGERNILPMVEKDYASDNGTDCVQMIETKNSTDIYGRNTYELLNKGVVAVTGGKFKTYEELRKDTTLADNVRGGYLYNARIYSMNNGLAVDNEEVGKLFHYEPSFSQWESYSVQNGTMAGDCVDLNTENPKVAEYLRNCYINYINMGVDAFRIDTLKHISRLTMNNEFIPQFREAGGEKFYMFGEACVRRCETFNASLPGISVCFYTWNQNKTTLDSSYPWKGVSDYIAGAKENLAQTEVHFNAQSPENQLTSDNAYLTSDMKYHAPDYSKASGLNCIDFRMHHQFKTASEAYGACLDEDAYFNDSTWNVTYVDSHDYGPNTIEGIRYNQGTSAWAENLDLMFTFRGVPCVYYGSEVEFQAGAQIEPWFNGNKVPYNESGRAYFGDHIEGSVTANGTGDYTASGAVAETLSSTLSQHIMRLNQIRAAVPALRKGQYKNYGDLKFVRRYTSANVDSVAVVSVSGSGSFSGLPAGKYIDVVSGDEQTIGEGGTIKTKNSGQGSLAVYVNATLDPSITGKIGTAGKYLK